MGIASDTTRVDVGPTTARSKLGGIVVAVAADTTLAAVPMVVRSLAVLLLPLLLLLLSVRHSRCIWDGGKRRRSQKKAKHSH